MGWEILSRTVQPYKTTYPLCSLSRLRKAASSTHKGVREALRTVRESQTNCVGKRDQKGVELTALNWPVAPSPRKITPKQHFVTCINQTIVSAPNDFVSVPLSVSFMRMLQVGRRIRALVESSGHDSNREN